MIKELPITNFIGDYLGDLYNESALSVSNINSTDKLNEISKLTFDIPFDHPKSNYVIPENIIIYNKQKYIIKGATLEHDNNDKKMLNVECYHYSSILSTQLVVYEELLPTTPDELMKIALLYDGDNPTLSWKVGTIDERLMTLYRGLDGGQDSPFSLLVKIADRYNAYLTFDSITMTVNLHYINTADEYVLDMRVTRNINNFSISYNTNEIVTRLYCYGANDDSGIPIDVSEANPTGLPYLEDYSYFLGLGYTQEYIDANKGLFVRQNEWSDSNYTTPQDLYKQGLIELHNNSCAKVQVKVTGINIESNLGKKMAQLVVGNIVKIVDDDTQMEHFCYVESVKYSSEEFWKISIDVTNLYNRNKVMKTMFSTINTVKNVLIGGKVDGSKLTAIETSQVTGLDSKLEKIESNTTKAQSSADGKNTIYYQTSAPTGYGYKTNDVWFDTNAGYKMYFWNGQTWIGTPFGTEAIGDLAITNAKISTLDAGKITTGELNANRISSGSITAEKLSTDAIKSNNYELNSYGYPISGTYLDLENGALHNKFINWNEEEFYIGNLHIDEEGDVFLYYEDEPVNYTYIKTGNISVCNGEEKTCTQRALVSPSMISVRDGENISYIYGSYIQTKGVATESISADNIKSGTVSITITAGSLYADKTITFSPAFANSPSVITQIQSGVQSISPHLHCNVVSVSKTSVTLRFLRDTSSGTQTNTIHWIAMDMT